MVSKMFSKYYLDDDLVYDKRKNILLEHNNYFNPITSRVGEKVSSNKMGKIWNKMEAMYS